VHVDRRRRSLFSRLGERLWADAESGYRSKILESLHPDRSALLLDVGCDDGAWTDVVRRRLGVPPSHVRGLEIVPERGALARARGFDVRIGDLDAPWPFEDESVDVVHANQVIEHVKRLDHFVRELRRVLAPGGAGVVCTENLASWHNVAALALGYQPFSVTNISDRGPVGNPFALHAGEPLARDSLQHLHVVTLAALRDLFEAHGFAVESSWGTGYHPFSGSLASRLAALDPRHAHFIGIVARVAA
jgi:SAM-dependent methyltransferase